MTELHSPRHHFPRTPTTGAGVGVRAAVIRHHLSWQNNSLNAETDAATLHFIPVVQGGMWHAPWAVITPVLFILNTMCTSAWLLHGRPEATDSISWCANTRQVLSKVISKIWIIGCCHHVRLKPPNWAKWIRVSAFNCFAWGIPACLSFLSIYSPCACTEDCVRDTKKNKAWADRN